MKKYDIKVLLVEDDPADVDYTKEALKSSKLNIDLVVIDSGEKVLPYLLCEGHHHDAAKPDVILLDLNLPKKDGREILKEIKSNHHLKSIPVVVLTTSSYEEDVVRSYSSGANCYVTKPVGFDQFQKIIKYIEEFWFAVSRLPHKG